MNVHHGTEYGRLAAQAGTDEFGNGNGIVYGYGNMGGGGPDEREGRST